MNYVLEYNSERDDLKIPEYGRNIKKLVDHCRELPTKEERNKMAKAIIEVMGNMHPHLRDVPDFKHKLWDQLFILANFDLDVDAPYEVITKNQIQAKPDKLPYPKTASKYKFYGNNIQTMIDEAKKWEDSNEKEQLKFTIANHMKKCFLNWNKDTVDDKIIFNHLYELSNGNIDLRNSDIELSSREVLYKKKPPTNNGKNKNYRKNKNKRSR